jgi:hypothetical protein
MAVLTQRLKTHTQAENKMAVDGANARNLATSCVGAVDPSEWDFSYGAQR